MYDFYSFYVFAKKDDKFFQNIEDSTSDIFRSIKISAPEQLSIIKTTEDEWKPSPTEWLGGYLLAEKMFDKMFKNKK